MMTKDSLNTYFEEMYSSPPKKNYPTKKTILTFFDDIWFSGLLLTLDLVEYGPSNNKGNRYFSVVFDIFSIYAGLIPLKNKYAQTKVNAFSQLIKTSKRKSNLLETYDGKEYVSKIFIDFLKQKNTKKYSRYSDKRVMFSDRYNRTTRNMLRKQSF